ncbi:MAG: MFS transporter [Firmicutes bacterium]|nr:MFS transporter [Bacillota bacterium]
MEPTVSRRQALYPWLICVSCTLMIFCTVGLCGNTMPIHFPFMISERGFSNTEMSAVTTIRCGLAFVCMGLLPRIMKLVRLRLLPLLSCLVIAASMWLLGEARSLFTLYLAASGLGVAYGLGSMVGASVLVRNWFSAREGFALSLCACGSGLANLVASPLITYAIENFGLAAALRLEAAAVVVLGLIMTAVIRDEPAQLGLRPYSSQRQAAMAADAAAAVDGRGPVRMSPRHGRLLFLAALFTGPTNITSCSFFTLQYTNCGYSPMVIAAALSMFGLLLTLAKLIYGWCNDRFGVYISNWLFLGVSILGNMVVALSPLFPVGVSVFVGLGLCALGYPPMMIGLSLWARDLFPPESYTGKVALYQQLSMAGGMAVTLLGGLLADLTGSYTPAYLICVALLIFSLASVQFLYRYYGRSGRGAGAAAGLS